MTKEKKIKCAKDDKFIYCRCGGCKPRSYQLPNDYCKAYAIAEFRVNSAVADINNSTV